MARQVSPWRLRMEEFVSQFANGTVIPGGGHYLGVNSGGYSLATYPAGNGTTVMGDAIYTTDIPDNSGIALFNTANPAELAIRLVEAGT